MKTVALLRRVLYAIYFALSEGSCQLLSLLGISSQSVAVYILIIFEDTGPISTKGRKCNRDSNKENVKLFSENQLWKYYLKWLALS